MNKSLNFLLNQLSTGEFVIENSMIFWNGSNFPGVYFDTSDENIEIVTTRLLLLDDDGPDYFSEIYRILCGKFGNEKVETPVTLSRVQ